ncbi:MAG: hypothetical protein AUJ52_06240 [Elusimicrobia bacterium CG1_02_63_36]|nr:MAG: hypothetical protein AUJ52_06240 [Elusimicrobia bacterium CG1_02_63_36]PIP81895.1 MAG: hypothetical protein COR54_17770 [Elusimicrobia bacterium CG22_combo_CG10-13_8_21_14_all_63_91]PJA11852.1 MAG: hypothetical protein COX66_18715 [Elusimicrobia bacterium CG_4_10_14_0_2_um_filter_63_34]PJB23203.1 MAG: hypothetical protein CO113_19200 [Elusimicrobia bacterium CG_4_9_14_3_um_filter_62_55]
MAGSVMKKSDGFTIVELIIASLLFSMVIAALSAIYATAFGQSGRTFRESRTKLMATMSMRALMRETAQATRIDLPAQDSYGRELSGCSNAKSDSTRITTAQQSTRFHFCVRNSNLGSGLCDGDPDAAPCLFYYTRSVSGNCPASDVTVSNCGNTTGTMGTPQLLASGLEELSTMPSDGYFSRRDGDFAQEDNAVRIAYNVTRPPGPNSPKLYFQVDTSASSQFGVRP